MSDVRSKVVSIIVDKLGVEESEVTNDLIYGVKESSCYRNRCNYSDWQ